MNDQLQNNYLHLLIRTASSALFMGVFWATLFVNMPSPVNAQFCGPMECGAPQSGSSCPSGKSCFDVGCGGCGVDGQNNWCCYSGSCQQTTHCGSGSYKGTCADCNDSTCYNVPTETSCNSDTNCGGYSCNGGACQGGTNCAAAGQTCSGGTCSTPCTPIGTCSSLGKNCGMVWDGCNNINCGSTSCGSGNCNNSSCVGNVCSSNTCDLVVCGTACFAPSSCCATAGSPYCLTEDGTRNCSGAVCSPNDGNAENAAGYNSACVPGSPPDTQGPCQGLQQCFYTANTGHRLCDGSCAGSYTTGAPPPPGTCVENPSDGNACTAGRSGGCDNACVPICLPTQETIRVQMNMWDGGHAAALSTMSWMAGGSAGLCAGTGSGSCSVNPPGPGVGPYDISSLSSYYGTAPEVTYSAGVSCNPTAWPLEVGTINLNGVHYYFGIVNVVVLGTGGTWKISNGAYSNSGAVTTVVGNAPLGNYVIEADATAGNMACVSQNAIGANCMVSGLGGTQIGTGDNSGMGPPVTFAGPTALTHGAGPSGAHTAITFYVTFQPAPATALTVTMPVSPTKLYVGGPTVAVTGGTPRAYVFIYGRKTNGVLEGTDNCAALTDIPPFNTFTPTLVNGTYTGAPFLFGDTTNNPAPGPASIGCWSVAAKVNTLPAIPVYSANTVVHAGSLAIKPMINNGGNQPDIMVAPSTPASTWSYTSPATETCGASPCTIGAYPFPLVDPLKGSGGSPGHTITMPWIGVSPTFDTSGTYKYVDFLGWVNKCNAVFTTNTIGVQTVPAPGCGGADRGVLEFKPTFINTRIKVKFKVNDGPLKGSYPNSVGGSPKGDVGGGDPLPGIYIITGKETRSGNSGGGVHWGMPN